VADPKGGEGDGGTPPPPSRLLFYIWEKSVLTRLIISENASNASIVLKAHQLQEGFAPRTPHKGSICPGADGDRRPLDQFRPPNTISWIRPWKVSVRLTQMCHWNEILNWHTVLFPNLTQVLPIFHIFFSQMVELRGHHTSDITNRNYFQEDNNLLFDIFCWFDRFIDSDPRRFNKIYIDSITDMFFLFFSLSSVSRYSFCYKCPYFDVHNIDKSK
jgi:hypothetical protein